MTRALAALLVAGCGSVTEVRVSVDNAGLAGVQTLRIRVTNPELSPEAIYDSQPLPVCQGGGDKCFRFPISLTLVPGSRDARVRVEVDALGAGDAPLESQASVFKFVAGVRQTLDFLLYQQCSGKLCATDDLGCSSDGQCDSVVPSGAPPTGIRRTQTMNGDNPGDASFTIPPPPAQPGDQVLVLVTASFVTAHSSWTAVQTSNGGTNYNLFHRQAGAGEANDTAGYTFVSDTPGQPVQWLVVVYRGAAAVEDLFNDIGVQPYLFPSQIAQHDGLLVDVAIAGSGSGICNMMPPPDGKLGLAPWYVYEIAARAGAPTGDRNVTCSSMDPAGLFTLLLR